jgi:hypothetical protein
VKQNWQTAMIVLRNDLGDVSHLPRSERLIRQKETSEKHRSELIDHLAMLGLEEEAEFLDAGPLRSLMVTGSPLALEEIAKVSCVEQVLPISPDVELGFLD